MLSASVFGWEMCGWSYTKGTIVWPSVWCKWGGRAIGFSPLVRDE